MSKYLKCGQSAPRCGLQWLRQAVSVLCVVVTAVCVSAAVSGFAIASEKPPPFNQTVHSWSLQDSDDIAISLPVDNESTPVEPALGLKRAQFKRALQLINNGQSERARYFMRALADYPILPYLHYQQLRKQISDSPDAQAADGIAAFRKRFGDDHLANALVRHLQSRLIASQNWRLFLTASALPGATDRHCATARARSETGESLQWAPGLVDLWIQGSRMPALCQDVLSALASDKLPGIKALWDRIYQAIDDGRHADARETAALLTRRDTKRVHGWLDAIADPSRLLQGDGLAQDDYLNRRILLDLLRRWSREDPPTAVDYWHSARHIYGFSADTRYDTDREMALRGAWLRLPQAYQWLHAFDVRPDDLEVMEWRVRSAMFAGDWSAVLESLLALPEMELAEDHWSYWHARALNRLDRHDEARAVYRRLAELPTYYGFLSADELGQPYRIKDVAIAGDTDQLQQLREHDDLIRAREYLQTGVLWEGRRIWNAVLKDLSVDEKAATARIAIEWNLPDRAIASANAAKRKDALSYRFPLAYSQTIDLAASRYDLDPDFILAVARRESAFMADIKSSAGAIGLMQLMPGTAKDVLRQQRSDDRWDLKGRSISLTNARMNIDMGSYYLNRIGQRFNGHLALMAASYNAGPHRTLAWLPEQGSVQADRWIDTIPFTETRRYVRAVLAYMTIFEWRRQQLKQPSVESDETDQPIKRLSDYLTPVTSNSDTALQSADNS